jgi:hypothetical protein
MVESKVVIFAQTLHDSEFHYLKRESSLSVLIGILTAHNFCFYFNADQRLPFTTFFCYRQIAAYINARNHNHHFPTLSLGLTDLTVYMHT